MGVNSRTRNIRPPLPAPTDSMDEGGNSGIDTDVATTVTTRTDKSSYEIPEDGSPITISTQKITSRKEGGSGGHSRDKSQTSLLIEYFEGSKSSDKTKQRPSVRVKVTPSSKNKRGSGGNDAIQITGIGRDRKPSYTRRISLGGSSKAAEIGVPATELSHSSESNTSGRPPVEIEVLDHNGSDLSTRSRGLAYAPQESNVSSMPADSMLEGSVVSEDDRSRALDRDDDVRMKTNEADYLKAPVRTRSRSASKERIAQKVMEKLGQTSSRPVKIRSDRSLGKEYDRDVTPQGRRKSSKSRLYDEEAFSSLEGGAVSNLAPSQKSARSTSDISNNPKLLGMVEDTIKRIILPEISSIKEDQRSDRNVRSTESSRRPSLMDDVYERQGITRRVSKSSSSPNISSKPKVVLNREGDDPGTTLSRGDSERVKEGRPSSRKSSGEKSSRSSNTIRDAAGAAAAGGLLTTAALRHHDSQDDVQARRKKRSKSRGSRSRSADVVETNEDTYLGKGDIPPMPMASRLNDSEVTRESLVSAVTERPHSRSSGNVRTPVREVSRGSLGDAMSPPASSTPRRTPVSRVLGMSHENLAIGSPQSPKGGMTTAERMAALAATGVGAGALATGAAAAYDHHIDADGYGSSPTSQRKISSPVQSVSSLKKNFENSPLVPEGLRPRSAASRSSAGRPQSGANSPSTKLARSRQQSGEMSEEDYGVHPGFSSAASGTPGTPQNESVDDWYERQHRLNDQYRDSLDAETTNRDSFTVGNTNRDSYQTNPYPEDEKRWTMYTEDSQPRQMDSPAGEQDLRLLGANPQFVHTPHGAESAVASLMNQSTMSSQGSPTRASYSDRMAAHLREMGKDTPPMYQGSTLSQTMPSQDRWSALKSHARNASASTSKDDVAQLESPRQSPAKSFDANRSIEEPVLGASGLPLRDDPLPEIGHFDDSKSDVTTNPSIIHGPLGGDATGKDTWPYTPEPGTPGQREINDKDSQSMKSGYGKEKGAVAAVAAGAAAGAAALAASQTKHQPSIEDERELTPDIGRRGGQIGREATPTSPAAFGDEGYVTDGHARSAGALTPRAEQDKYSKRELEEYNRAMDAQDLGDDDPFTGNDKRARHISGDSHGMASPIYDSATGKGMDHIQSKDIVALMDHLTVRDAQRNARDTEILVSLVRSTAEMRQSFDDIKRFIVEQDRMIMQNADRGADQTVQKVLGGPRPQPAGSPRTPRQQSEEEIQTKRKGVLRRALKGLTGGKSANDLARVETMLMQILDNVEDLKQNGGTTRAAEASYTNDSLDTYERLRNAPDPGYEPEGQAGTSSTASQSGNLSLTPRNEKQQFHSGYDGRRGSNNRVSTVLEGDEDDELEPHESMVLDHQFENNERMITPTQEMHWQRGLGPSNTPPRHTATYNKLQGTDLTPRSADKQQKHKSNNSSLFGVPKVSRWSRTTASSGARDSAAYDSPNVAAQNQKAVSEASRSGSALDRYDDEDYDLRDDDRLRSTQSLAREQQAGETRSIRSQASKISRNLSPLIPSEASASRHGDYDDQREEPSPVQEDLEEEWDDPKYQAQHRSLVLQHPQPRQGTTPRHQNHLETKAYEFDGTTGTNSDVSQASVSDFDPAMWGSSGTAGLAKHRLSQFEPMSPVSMGSPAGAYGGSRLSKDEGPLVPQQKPAIPPKVRYEEPDPEDDDLDWEPEPQFSNSGFSRGAYYSSPFGSGHLLEPIEEVRYSLETDSGHISPEPQVAAAKAVDMRSTARKITGPRPMGTTRRSSQEAPTIAQPRIVETTGTVRRKPVSGS